MYQYPPPPPSPLNKKWLFKPKLKRGEKTNPSSSHLLIKQQPIKRLRITKKFLTQLMKNTELWYWLLEHLLGPIFKSLVQTVTSWIKT